MQLHSAQRNHDQTLDVTIIKSAQFAQTLNPRGHLSFAIRDQIKSPVTGYNRKNEMLIAIFILFVTFHGNIHVDIDLNKQNNIIYIMQAILYIIGF